MLQDRCPGWHQASGILPGFEPGAFTQDFIDNRIIKKLGSMIICFTRNNHKNFLINCKKINWFTYINVCFYSMSIILILCIEMLPASSWINIYIWCLGGRRRWWRIYKTINFRPYLCVRIQIPLINIFSRFFLTVCTRKITEGPLTFFSLPETQDLSMNSWRIALMSQRISQSAPVKFDSLC
jgi:hypothetical protein